MEVFEQKHSVHGLVRGSRQGSQAETQGPGYCRVDLAFAWKSLCLEGLLNLQSLSSVWGQVYGLQVGMELESAPEYPPCPQCPFCKP